MDFERFGKTETIDLKENGRNIPVTNENKLEYVHLICQEKMVGSVKNQVKIHPKSLNKTFFSFEPFWKDFTISFRAD
jgi:hypothetical protein